MIVCDIKKCTGCMACMNICPGGAIKTSLSDTYKTIPMVEESLCKNCGLCKRVCPENNPYPGKISYKCYGVTKAEGADTKNCATAGVGAELAKYVTNNGGIVFGAGYKDGKVCHISASTEAELEMLKGSKYVQSDICFCYKEAKSYLDSGRNVLFTGTPCQIAGLMNYLGREYENLVTADLVCHGVSPHKFLDDYLSDLKISDKCREVRFRGEEDYFFTVYGDDGIIYKESATTNLYYRAYYNKILMRDNCYACEYATYKNRPADITIGDFWGIDRARYEIREDVKVSLVLINTKKGAELFANLNMPGVETDVLEGVSKNAQLKTPCPEDEEREKFLNNYHRGFAAAVNKTKVKKNIRRNKRNLAIFRIKAGIKRGLKL